MCNVSQLVINIQDVCFKTYIELHSLHTMNTVELNNKIIGKFSESIND